MVIAFLPFGALAPDLNPRLNDQTLRVADGVYPSPDGYAPIGQWAQTYTALPAAPKGGASFVSSEGTASIIVGTATNLYRAFSDGWQSIASGYSVQGDQRWRFIQFGGVAIATNASDVMQAINLSDMTVTALGGDPPKFESLAVVADGFLVGTRLDGDAMSLEWCAQFNAQQWTPGTGQSDYQTQPAGGQVVGIFSGESGIVLQSDRITAMDYVGGNKIFDFSRIISESVGCVTVHSTAQWGKLAFFLSKSGWMMLNGEQLQPIGRDLIDAEFRENYDVSDWSSMSTAIDQVRSLLHISMGDKHYIYDWQLQKWSTATYASPIIFSGVTKGITIEEDEPDVTGDDVIDTGGLDSLDDARFLGGDPRLYVFHSDRRLGAFTGTPMAATLTGNDIEVFPGHRADIRNVRADIDATSGITVTLETRQRLGDSATSTAASTLQASGDMPIRASGRYTRATFGIAAGTTWSHAKGYRIDAQPGSGR